MLTLTLFPVIYPGLNRLRGVILYELQAVFSVRSRKSYLANDISKQELESHVKVSTYTADKVFQSISVFQVFQIVRKMLQEASTIFSWESEDTEEGRLAQISRMELNDVNQFLRSIQ